MARAGINSGSASLKRSHNRQRRLDLDTYVLRFGIVIFAVITGVISVALETSGEAARAGWNNVLFVFLLFELVLRIFSDGAAFHKNRWNIVAFFVLIAWAPIYDDPVYALRSLILVRIFEYAIGIPKLRTLLYGIFGGSKMMLFIVITISFVLYVYALVGFSMFAGNDPWHFGDLQRSLITLFRAGTLEDWTEIFYVVSSNFIST